MTSDGPAPFHLAPMTEALARDTADWHFDGDVSIYDQPDWATMVEQGWGLTDPVAREREFVALVDPDGRAAGLLRFVDHADALEVGLSLRPDLCGRGLGAVAMALVDEAALRRRGPCLLRLEVRTFNERAIRCYERAGWQRIGVFQRTTQLGLGEFLAMERRLEAT